MPDAPPTLRFLGAADTVTGSRYLVEAGGRRILVDCGLFQGYKKLRERNRADFPVDPASIDCVLLTHAHLDHSGYIPALVRDGFRGEVLCTPATRDLCELLLPDSGHLLEEEARYALRKGYSKHATPIPLYTEEDARASLRHIRTRPFDAAFEVGPGIRARFLHAGHILGAAQIHLEVQGIRLHFSGDLGRPHDPLMRAPAPLPACDVLVCESTYGNRVHPAMDPEQELAPVIRRVAARGGTIVVPAFAVGRAQALMLDIARLRQKGEIPPLPVFLNSPMAIDATELYRRHHDEHCVPETECSGMYGIATLVRTVEESIALNRRRGPMIILSASGMATGGRVLHHIAAFAPEPHNAILLSGYQAAGTRGAALAGGATSLRMFGREVPIRAEVVQLQSLSGHADAAELVAWMGAQRDAPAITYLTHGEPDAADALRLRVRHTLDRACRVPEHMERVALAAGSR
ncbi:MBL fold metallo-hydrolase RNA specificity domain-containing protein [Coralloluteibacterium thermophilus]|uniref:MBL fold metallo-hydrolase RNA specificity domain-containing protein n=1 Tax=Coralloluteibacterium thermophilum TaxID=2707049 RepID=A0ABV9NM74_9GAMM